MIICEANIHNFGKLHDEKYIFRDGINLIYGPNESGKTTLFQFIKFILYGSKETRSKSAIPVRQKYFSHNADIIGGNIIIEHSNIKYCIERFYSPQYNKITVTDISVGKEVTDSDILFSPGKYFTGMNSDVFSNTCFLSDISAKVTPDKKGEIISSLACGNRYEENTYINVSNRLKEKISILSSNRRKDSRLSELTEQITAIENKYTDTEQNILKIKECSATLSQRNNYLNKLLDEISALKSAYSDKKQYAVKYTGSDTSAVIGYTLGIAAIAAALIFACFRPLNFTANTAVLVCLIAIACICFAVANNKKRKKCVENSINDFTISDNDDKIKELTDEYNILCAQIANDTAACKNLNLLYEERDRAKRELEYAREEYENIVQELNALNIAKTIVKKAYDQLQSEFSPALSDKAAVIFSEITENSEYSKSVTDDEFNAKIYNGFSFSDIRTYSRGTYEQFYFSLRYALVGLLEHESTLPVFFDDAFSSYDDTRLCRTLDFLCSERCKRQIFISSCHAREYLYFRNLNINIIDFTVERNGNNGC